MQGHQDLEQALGLPGLSSARGYEIGTESDDIPAATTASSVEVCLPSTYAVISSPSEAFEVDVTSLPVTIGGCTRAVSKRHYTFAGLSTIGLPLTTQVPPNALLLQPVSSLSRLPSYLYPPSSSAHTSASSVTATKSTWSRGPASSWLALSVQIPGVCVHITSSRSLYAGSGASAVPSTPLSFGDAPVAFPGPDLTVTFQDNSSIIISVPSYSISQAKLQITEALRASTASQSKIQSSTTSPSTSTSSSSSPSSSVSPSALAREAVRSPVGTWTISDRDRFRTCVLTHGYVTPHRSM